MSEQTNAEYDRAVEQLAIWLDILNRLNNSKPKMDKFDKQMAKTVHATLDKLSDDITTAVKAFGAGTDDDWTPYLNDFNIFEWQPGDFQQAILDWLTKQIKIETSKLS